MITILAHPRVPSPDGASELVRGDVQAVELDDALARAWPTDAHLTAYEPVELPADDGQPMPVRMAGGALTAGLCARMVLLIGDLDGPGHVATPEWRADVEPRLESTGWRWYWTRGGARVIAELDEPFDVTSREDAATWTARYKAWCAQVESAHGLALDRRCADWTRIMRLPDVVRDGSRTAERVHGGRGAATLPPAPEAAPAPERAPAAPADYSPTPAKLAAMHAIVATLGDPYARQGSRWALCGAIGGALRKHGWTREDCAALLRAWLPDGDPAIDVEAGVRWACGAWAKDAASVSNLSALVDLLGTSEAAAVSAACKMPDTARREMRATPVAAPDTEPFAPAELASNPWEACADFSQPPEPIVYACPGLCLAPSTGKISLIAGQPGAGKGPLADHLAVCFALGLPVFGALPVERSRVLLADFEGSLLTRHRVRRFAVGAGHEPGDLNGWLRVVDASSVFDPTDTVALQQLASVVEEHAIGVVVIDSYTSAMAGTGIEANSPQYALLARLLGQLGCLVIAVAHSNKSADDTNRVPRLADVAFSGALVAASQTVLMLQKPEDGRARIFCGRAPERAFSPIELAFRDVEGGLVLEQSTAPVKEPRPAIAPADRSVLTRGLQVVAAGRRVWDRLHGIEGHYSRGELADCAGESRSVALRAIALLVGAGLVEIRAGAYCLTDAGRAATDAAVGAALGKTGPTVRG